MGTWKLLAWQGVAFLLALHGTGVAYASFDLQAFHPNPSPTGFFTTEGGSLLPHLQFATALGINYGSNPLSIDVVSDGGLRKEAGAVVAHRLDIHALASIGLFHWIEFGIDMPLVILSGQDRNRLDAAQLEVPIAPLRPIGLGDIRFIPKIKIVSLAAGVLDIAFLVPFTVPSANGRAYAGDNTMTVAPALGLSSRFLRHFRVGANVGYRVRPKEKFQSTTFDDELTFKLGLATSFGFVGQPDLALMIDIYGTTDARDPFGLKGTSDTTSLTPVELAGGVRYLFLKHWMLQVGLGTALTSGVGASIVRAYASMGYMSGS